MKLVKVFNKMTKFVSTPAALCLSALSLVLYLIGGLIWGFSNNYNLVANTFMSAVSYLLLFLIQITSYRSAQIVETKIDELILSNKAARNEMLALEDKTDEEIDKIHEKFLEKAKSIPSDVENHSH